MVFIKEIGPSHEEVHLDNVENKTRSGITDFTRHIYSRVGQDTDSVPASPRDTDSVLASPQDHKGKRQLTLQEVADEEERLRSGQDNRLTEKLVIPEGPLPGGMRRSDAGTSGDQRIGKQIGEYSLRSILGQGSFGKVYLGDHVDARKPPAAVKVLSIPLDRPEANQFFAEVQALERLKHDHIIKIYKYGLEDIEHHYPYLALEYAYHGALDDIHPEGTRLPSRQIAEYLDQLAPALDYAHSQQFMHRDLKPGNLLVAKKPNGEKVLKIGDFGLALVFQRTTSRRTQGFAGTLEYAAPEQLMGKPGPESDLYAVGIMTYEWLSGHLPFQGTQIEIMSQHMMRTPDSIPGISQDIQRVVFCALAKDPKQRKQHFKSVAEYAQAFRRACGLPVPAQQVEAGPSRQVRDQLAEMRLQDTSDRSIIRHPERLTEICTLNHGDIVHEVRFSPNGQFLATIGLGNDGQCKIWNANTGEWLDTLNNGGGVWDMQFSPNGHILATLGGEKQCKIWNANTRKLLNTLDNGFAVRRVLFSPNGQLLAIAGCNGQCKIWNANIGELLNTFRHGFDCYEMQFSPNGHILATGGGEKQCKIWNANTGELLNTLNNGVSVRDMHFSPNGQLLATTGKDGQCKIWNANTGELLNALNHGAYVNHVRFSPSGQFLATTGKSAKTENNEQCKIWNANTGEFLNTLNKVYIINFSPNGQFLVTIGEGGYHYSKITCVGRTGAW